MLCPYNLEVLQDSLREINQPLEPSKKQVADTIWSHQVLVEPADSNNHTSLLPKCYGNRSAVLWELERYTVSKNVCISIKNCPVDWYMGICVLYTCNGNICSYAKPCRSVLMYFPWVLYSTCMTDWLLHVMLGVFTGHWTRSGFWSSTRSGSKAPQEEDQVSAQALRGAWVLQDGGVERPWWGQGPWCDAKRWNWLPERLSVDLSRGVLVQVQRSPFNCECYSATSEWRNKNSLFKMRPLFFFPVSCFSQVAIDDNCIVYWILRNITCPIACWKATCTLSVDNI